MSGIDPMARARSYIARSTGLAGEAVTQRKLAALSRQASEQYRAYADAAPVSWLTVEQVAVLPEAAPDQLNRLVQVRNPGGRDTLCICLSYEGTPTWVALNTLQTGTDAAISFALTWGSYGTGNGQFSHPRRLAIDGFDDRVYVADTYNDRVQVFDADGSYLGKFGSAGTGNGQFFSPNGIAVNQSSRDIYVADTGNNRIQQFSAAGFSFIRTWGSFGSGSGQFNLPTGLAIDGSGNAWVADSANHRVQKFSASGTHLLSFGTSGSDAGELSYPYAVAFDSAGHLWVADTSNNRIQQFDASGSFRSQFGSYGNGDGQFFSPISLAIDSQDNLYVMDAGNDRVQKFAPDGAFLGKFGEYGTGPGQFNFPYDSVLNAAGDALYVADSSNSRVQKFRIGSDGQIQYLNGGASATDPDLAWDAAAKRLRAGIESGIAWLAGGVLRPATVTTRTNTGSVANGASANITASCNPGEIAVGGGYYTGNTTGMAAVVSRPDGAPPNAWVATVYNASGAARTAYCYVVCLG